MKDPIFIIGLPRSGSTLWLDIIAKNNSIFRIGEMHFLTPWRKDFRYFYRQSTSGSPNPESMQKMVEVMFSNEDVPGISSSFWHYDIKVVNNPRLKKNLAHRIINSDKSLGSIFRAIIEEITIFNGYNRCCAKFPVYANYIPELLKWYPECRLVHITRDPRAIAVSKMNDPGGTERMIKKHPYMSFALKRLMVWFVVLQYIWSSKIHCRYKEIGNYQLFRYEDLLVDPERVVKNLCSFIRIDFTTEMMHPRQGQSSSVTGRKAKGFDKRAGTRWKTMISPFERGILTILTRKSMERFAFDPSIHPIYQI